MDVTLDRDEIKGDVIFGRFFYEDIFARRWWRRKRIRTSGFILRISEKNETLAIDAPAFTPTGINAMPMRLNGWQRIGIGSSQE
jgi:hypothetical protein